MSPFEFVATPAASPRCTTSGNLRISVAVNGSSGMTSCADGAVMDAASAVAATRRRTIDVMMASRGLLPPGGRGRRFGVEQNLLRPPRRDLGDVELIRIATV